MEGARRRRRRWLAWFRWVGIDLRTEEVRLVGGLFFASFVLGVFQFSSKAVRQASYIDQFGADRLPWVYLGVAISAYPVLRLYGAIADRWSAVAVVTATLSIIIAGLLGFWWLMAEPSPWVPVAYYVWVAIATALALTQLWSLTNSYLDARQARRLFGLIGAGSLLGGVLGGQVATFSRDEPRNALLVAAVMLAIMIVVIYRLSLSQGEDVTLTGAALKSNRRTGRARDAAKEPHRPRGLEILRSSSHLRLIAAILLITVIVAQIIDLQFSWAIENSRDSYAGRVSAFGNVFSMMGLAAFVFQILLTPRIHRSFGVGSAMRVLPGFVLLGSVVLLFASTMSPAALIFVLGFLRVGDNGLRYSLDHVTRELLFVPVPAEQRVEAKGYVDVFIHRFGKALGAVLLLAVTFEFVSVIGMTWVTLVLVAVWILLTVRAKKHYVEALRKGLEDRDSWTDLDAADDLTVDPNDINTLELLVEALGSSDPSKVVGSVELLRSHERAKLVPPLLLYHDNASVRRVTLEVLLEAGRKDALPLIERCVGDDDATVRAVAITALAELSSVGGPELMVGRLDDADPRVRAAAIHCILTQGNELQVQLAESALGNLLRDGDPLVRVEAAKVLGRLPEPQLQQHVIGLLFDCDKKVVRAMIVGLRERVKAKESSPIYISILISLLRDRRLKHDARETLVAYGPGVLPALSHFLSDPNEQIWVRRAIPKTLVHFSGRGAAPVLYQGLVSSDDPMQRSKIIEALAAMPDHERDIERLRECLHRMTLGYFESLIALKSLSVDGFELQGTHLDWKSEASTERGGAPLKRRLSDQPLVFRLLEENRQKMLRDMSALVGVLLPGVELGQLFDDRRELGQQRRALSHAVEYLDNVLDGRLRDEVVLVLDDLPLERRLKSAHELFDIPQREEEATLAWLLEKTEGHEVERWLAAAAAYRVGERKLSSLYDKIALLADDETDGLVQETAQLVMTRMIA